MRLLYSQRTYNQDKWPPAEAVKRLVQTIVRVVTTPGDNKPKNFEIFIHKVDCLKSEQSQGMEALLLGGIPGK